MIVVKVTYTVQSDFAQQNEENIHTFMKDFRELKNNDFRYLAFVCEDGKSFVHLSMYQNEEIQKLLLDFDSFKAFQEKRDDSGLEVKPTIEKMSLVSS